jgi:chromosome segregation ATPase
MVTKTIEKRVSDLEEVVDDIPRLIDIRFAYIRAQMDSLDARVGTVEAKVDRLQAEVAGVRAEISGVPAEIAGARAKIDALPGVLADMLDERGRRGR